MGMLTVPSSWVKKIKYKDVCRSFKIVSGLSELLFIYFLLGIFFFWEECLFSYSEMSINASAILKMLMWGTTEQRRGVG